MAEFTTVPHPYEFEHAHQFVTEVVPAGWSNGSYLTWGIYERTASLLLGVVSLSQIEDGISELGYWIDVAARGRGLMTEAVGHVVDFAFSAPPAGLGLNRLGWEAMSTNEASARVAQKAGFSWEGRRRSAAVRLGRTYDLTFAGLLRNDARTATVWPGQAT